LSYFWLHFLFIFNIFQDDAEFRIPIMSEIDPLVQSPPLSAGDLTVVHTCHHTVALCLFVGIGRHRRPIMRSARLMASSLIFAHGAFMSRSLPRSIFNYLHDSMPADNTRPDEKVLKILSIATLISHTFIDLTLFSES